MESNPKHYGVRDHSIICIEFGVQQDKYKMESDTFDEFFKSATGFYPYPYQKKLALDDRNIPELIH